MRPASSASCGGQLGVGHRSGAHLAEQAVDDQLGRVLGAGRGGVDADLGLLGRFVGAVDAGEVLELARARLLVEALHVARLGDRERGVDEDLDELALGQHRADHLALGAERADEGGEHDQAGVGHQLGDLADAADVLDPVGLGEAEVLVEPVADIVAVEQEGVPAHARGASSRPGWRWSTCPSPTGR